MADQEITCSYCCENLQSMVDPKELPCGHVFCILCLKADANMEVTSHQCVICRRVHQLTDFDRLPTPKSENKFVDNTSSKLKCDRCKTEPAISYCIDCAEKRCSRHMEDHDGYFESPHEKVDMTEFIKNQHQYSTAKCSKHKKSRVTMVCSQCYQYNCEQCLKEDPSGAVSCPGEEDQVVRATTSSVGMKEHSYRRLEVVGKRLRNSLKLKTSSIAQKLPEVVRCEKRAWSKMEEMVENCQKLQKTVTEKSGEQINLILEQSENLKEQIRDHQITTTGQVVKFVEKLMVKKQHMEDVRKRFHHAVHTASTCDLIDNRISINVASERTNSINIKEFSWTDPILEIGSKRKMEMRLDKKETARGPLGVAVTRPEEWSAAVEWDSDIAPSDDDDDDDDDTDDDDDDDGDGDSDSDDDTDGDDE